MNIIIDGKKAVVKENFSLEYNEENPLFTESEGYTLSISLPLSGCKENLAIFGHLDRKDIDTRKSVFSCHIDSSSFVRSGVFVVVEIQSEELKGQFLSGISVKNYTNKFSKLNDIYVDELKLGEISSIYKAPENIVIFSDYTTDGAKAIFLPWREDGADTIHNKILTLDGPLVLPYPYLLGTWENQEANDVPFPYLLPLTKDILTSLGYDCDLSEWAKDRAFANMIACNAFQGQKFLTESLPNWSVKEYLENLSLFMFGVFDIDDVSMTVKFSFYKKIKSSVYYVDKVISNHKIEYTDDCKYLGASTIKYTDVDNVHWAFDDCSELFSSFQKLPDYELISKKETYADLIQFIYDRNYTHIKNQETPTKDVGRILYAKDIDTYFCMRYEQYTASNWKEEIANYYIYRLTPINRFGSHNGTSENEYEVCVIPAIIPLSTGEVIVFPRSEKDGLISEKFTYNQPAFAANVVAGNKDVGKKFFENLFVANARTDYLSKYFRPSVDKSPSYTPLDVRAEYAFDEVNYRLSRIENELPKIDSSIKYSIDFISDDMPRVMSIFYIQGKKYLCEKISVAITPNGVSQLKKGTFYQIVD